MSEARRQRWIWLVSLSESCHLPSPLLDTRRLLAFELGPRGLPTVKEIARALFDARAGVTKAAPMGLGGWRSNDGSQQLSAQRVSVTARRPPSARSSL